MFFVYCLSTFWPVFAVGALLGRRACACWSRDRDFRHSYTHCRNAPLHAVPFFSWAVAAYSVCNGLSNQLVSHIGSIAQAVKRKEPSLLIPDVFIVNGVQKSRDQQNAARLQNVQVSDKNSIPFRKVFDDSLLLKTVKELGVDARMGHWTDGAAGSCDWKTSVLDTELLQKLVHAFRPSKSVKNAVDKAFENLIAKGVLLHSKDNLERGVCIHDRNGEDWKHHCKIWENIKDAVWRKNCIDHSNSSMRDLVFNRIPNSQLKGGGFDNMPAYICSDTGVDASFTHHNSRVFTRLDMLGVEGEKSLMKEVLGHAPNMLRQEYLAKYRDLWALFDFYVCQTMKHFVGNSVSTFSALQIILRNGDAAWHNSRSIPLAALLTVRIPVVYTYTETSPSLGQKYLKVAITSARKQMGRMQPIHVIYHGNTDSDFLKWLEDQAVTVHEHKPAWIDMVAIFRKAGKMTQSHLFAHAGMVTGTFQRIDIPLFIGSEYCLLLDYDTIISRSFSIRDFGLEIPASIGMARESAHLTSGNAGVMLLNVPRMRETREAFLRFISDRSRAVVEPLKNGSARYVAFKSGPMDQGAYIDFYGREINELSRMWNVRPYWQKRTSVDQIILHFHGAKAHDYLISFYHLESNIPISTACPVVCRGFCEGVTRTKSNNICSHMSHFAELLRDAGLTNAFCYDAFNSSKTLLKPEQCISALTDIGAWRESPCKPIFGASMTHGARQEVVRSSVKYNKSKLGGKEEVPSMGIEHGEGKHGSEKQAASMNIAFNESSKSANNEFALMDSAYFYYAAVGLFFVIMTGRTASRRVCGHKFTKLGATIVTLIIIINFQAFITILALSPPNRPFHRLPLNRSSVEPTSKFIGT